MDRDRLYIPMNILIGILTVLCWIVAPWLYFEQSTPVHYGEIILETGPTIYADCEHGSDVLGLGTKEKPYRTLKRVINKLYSIGGGTAQLAPGIYYDEEDPWPTTKRSMGGE